MLLVRFPGTAIADSDNPTPSFFSSDVYGEPLLIGVTIVAEH